LQGDLFDEVPEAEVVQSVLYPYMSALLHIHGKGVVHQDIKMGGGAAAAGCAGCVGGGPALTPLSPVQLNPLHTPLLLRSPRTLFVHVTRS
jgi:hypothetical protein